MIQLEQKCFWGLLDLMEMLWHFAMVAWHGVTVYPPQDLWRRAASCDASLASYKGVNKFLHENMICIDMQHYETICSTTGIVTIVFELFLYPALQADLFILFCTCRMAWAVLVGLDLQLLCVLPASSSCSSTWMLSMYLNHRIQTFTNSPISIFKILCRNQCIHIT